MSLLSSFDSSATDIIDVVVVGGGIVGGLTALLLQQGGITPLVLDAAPELSETHLAKRDPRVLALSPATIGLLSKVGMWQRLARQCVYTGMQVWIRDGFGTMDLGSAEYAPSHNTHTMLGSMVEPSVLSVAMQQQLDSVLNADEKHHYQRNVKVIDLGRFKDYWQLSLSNGNTIKTKLVIAADGANSSIRTMAGIDIDLYDYKQTAFTCAIRTEKPHQQIARQVFLPTGPLAFLPMADANDPIMGHWLSIVWTLPEPQAETFKTLTVDELKQKIASASGYALGQVEQIESIGFFPLKARQTKHYYLSGLALLGDAAHVVHPMAGQGVNIGCLDADALVNELLKDAKRGLWAHEQTLQRYAKRRRLPNSMMMHGMTLLGWLTGDRSKLVTWARNQGFSWLGHSSWFKNRIIETASGLKEITNSH